MEELTLTCETVTPMFCYGADGQTPEIRAQSIKGALRFWWRAMQGETDTSNLYKKEAALFGAPDEKIGKSKIFLRIMNEPINGILNSAWDIIDWEWEHSKNNPQKKWRIAKNHVGTAYLFYSILMSFGGKAPKKCYDVNKTFEIFIKIGTNEREIIDALWCLSIFGGIGARTRRGGGNFKVTNITASNDKEISNILVPSTIENKEALGNYIKSRLGSFLPPLKNDKYSTLKDYKLFILDSSDNWLDALEEIALPYKKYRTANKSKLTKMPNYGIPVIHTHGYKPQMLGGKLIGNKLDDKNIKDRRSSPIIFRIIKIHDNLFFPIILYMNAELLPNGYEIVNKKFTREHAAPDPTIYDDFFNEIRKYPHEEI